MKFAYFPGCKIAHHLPWYGSSLEAVCAAVGIELVKLEFSCCGWPVRHESEVASLYSAVRNFIIAHRAGLPILTPCKCCFGNLKYAQSRMQEDVEQRTQVLQILHREGLVFPEAVPVFHLLNVLESHVGFQVLTEMTKTPLSGVRVACHYGCHALRPGIVTGFDDPLAPTLFERLVESIGAESVKWDLRLECCGHPLRGRDDKISDALMRKKLEDAASAGADVLATACTYCQLQFDRSRAKLPVNASLRLAPPAVLVTQLIGTAFGLDETVLGLKESSIPWRRPVL